jgi:diaminopimelate decarboxylase
MSLDLVHDFPEVETLNLGGGYKVGRMNYEKSTDLFKIGVPVATSFLNFAEKTNRKIKLEIEPGTFLMANTGVLLSTVQDIVNTGADGHQFLKLDSGMTEVLRPSLYVFFILIMDIVTMLLCIVLYCIA